MSYLKIDEFKKELIEDIRKDLLSSWMRAREPEIQNEVSQAQHGFDREKENEVQAFEAKAKRALENKIRQETDALQAIADKSRTNLRVVEAKFEQLKTEENLLLLNSPAVVEKIKKIEQEIRALKDTIQNYKETIDALPGKLTRDYEDEKYSELARIETRYQHKLEQERTRITQKFETKFDYKWLNKIKPIFDNQYEQFAPRDIKRKLIERHPWLEKEQEVRVMPTVIMLFLQEILRDSFWTCLENKVGENWRAIDIEFKEDFIWRAIDGEALVKKIQGYPLSNINFYNGMHWFESNQAWLLNRVPKRFDAYRFILNEYASDFTPQKLSNGVYCTKIAPMLLSELQQLSPEEKAHLKTILVNIGSEDLPHWVMLHKQENKWTCYCSEEDKNKVHDVINQIDFDQNITLHVVDVSQPASLSYSSLVPAFPSSQWHVHLFARVLPWCQEQSQNKAPLEDYRQTVPFPILFQYFWQRTTTNGQKICDMLTNRFPFSQYSISEFLQEDREENYPPVYLLKKHYPLTSMGRWNVFTLLKHFDKKDLQIVSSRPNGAFDTIIFSNCEALSDGIKQSYHHGIDTLVLPSTPSADVKKNLADKQSVLSELVNYHLHITSVSPRVDDYAFFFYCAARNRFFASFKPQYLVGEPKQLIKHYQEAWPQVGQAIHELMRTTVFTDDEVNQAVVANETWCASGLKNDVSIKPKLFQLMQIAQMGKQGLDALFDTLHLAYVQSWNPPRETSAPNLAAVFDLQGSVFDKPVDYIQYLTKKISDFGRKSANTPHTACAPLFKKLDFILPKELDENVLQAVCELIKALDARCKAFPDDACEVTLHNAPHLDVSDKNRQPMGALLNQLQALAEKPNRLQIAIRIPAWDKAAPTNHQMVPLKAQYRQLQNNITNNIRYARYPSLKAKTQLLEDCVNNQLKQPFQDLAVEEQRAQWAQLWDGKDEKYPLTAESPSIQQQLQQQVTQQLQLQATKQKEVHREHFKEIAQFSGSETDLITRDNVDEKCAAYWSTVDEKIKRHSGWKRGQSLVYLFDLFSGSEKNASFVIQRFHPEAFEKMMQFAPAFRSSIDWDNTPGFKAWRSPQDGALILTYSEKQELEDLLARKVPGVKPNSNAVTLKKFKPAVNLSGDYRQFSTFKTQDTAMPEQHLQTFWQFLAHEDTNAERIENHQKSCLVLGVKPNDLNGASVIMQRFNVTPGKVQSALDVNTQIDLLKAWARKKYPNDHVFINTLFETQGPVEKTFTPENLQALGQLFNHYDIQDERDETGSPVVNASVRWLEMAKLVFDTYPKYFLVWKQRLLDPVADWSEVLEKEEIDALVISTLRLSKRRDLQAILWELVDAHGSAVGPMRFTEIWPVFNQLVKKIEEKNLSVNVAKFSNFFKTAAQSDDFHGTHFLRRLNFVLNNAEKMSNSTEIQKDILNHVDKIDWSHDGFHYYTRYEDGCAWRSGLKITDLEPLITSKKGEKASYVAKWDINLDLITDRIPYALRYCDQRMKLNKSEFDAFQDILTTHGKLKKVSTAILRLVIASKAIGVDSIKDLQEAQLSIQNLSKFNPHVIARINNQLSLDRAELNPYSYRLRMADVGLLVEVLSQTVYSDLKLDLERINILGQALHCYAKMHPNDPQKRKESLKKLIEYGMSKGFNDSLVTTYPWLIDDVTAANLNFVNFLTNKKFEFVDPIGKHSGFLREMSALTKLRRQLQSIDWKATTWYPSYEDIDNAAKAISNSPKPKEKKDEVIAGWIKQHCAITDQDAPYRLLTETERNALKKSQYLNWSLAFEKQNAALYEKLLFTLAVPVDWHGDIETHFGPLFNFFAKIDCKTHYNELSMLLGLLNTQSQVTDGTQCYYAFDQLTSWLDALYDKPQFESGHYPVNLIAEVLKDQLKDPNASLLNQNLLFLNAQDQVAERLQPIFREINESYLSYHAKKTLIKLAIQFKNDKQLRSIIKKVQDQLLELKSKADSPVWESCFCDLLTRFAESPEKNKSFSAYLDSIALLTKPTDESDLDALWESNQIKLLQEVAKENISLEQIQILFPVSDDIKEQLIRMILVESWHDRAEIGLVQSITESLNGLKKKQLRELANYYASKPTPSLSNLHQLFQSVTSAKAADLIHHFESVIQATDKEQKSKRVYSLDENDLKNIQRVLDGFKLKGQGFVADDEQKQLVNLLYCANTYSQFNRLDQLETEKVVALLHEQVRDLRHQSSKDKDFSRAQILACMRELLLRKTGKWLNHTQMIDLLYGALHNDESLLHQIYTGEGKSLITLMRVSFRALMGEVVDVFSSKESLSLRDHEDFAMVFDAFGIRHSHIHAGSKASEYHSETINGIGAVNYATAGNFSLFLSGLIWEGKIDRINLHNKNRVAFVDEADYVLLEESTLFNCSDKSSGNSAYNLDEWVYREAYEFYLEYRETFEGYINNCPSVSRNLDLKNLCARLQENEAQMSPKHAQFFNEYIIPAAINPSAENLEVRDQQLRQLLTAAHIASGLVKDTHFCVMNEERPIDGQTTLETQFAKVMIKNQVYHGSTYSDLVQQFLHVRLNREAIQQGKAPRFFVEPKTEIALSLNARYVFKNYYNRIEACTGTAGDAEDIKVYKDEFGINRVIKLPKHVASKTEFLEPIYCLGGPLTVAEIAMSWLNDPDNARPVPGDLHNEIKEIRTHLSLELHQEYTVDQIKAYLDNPFAEELDPLILKFVRKINGLMAKEEQIQRIVDDIIKNKQGSPILITCTDDNAVVEFGTAIQDRLAKQHLDYRIDTDLQDTHGAKKPKFIVDTNKSGRTEADVLPFAGRIGSVTISSRMGRGTDIPLESEKHGLYVIRTSAAMPSTVKQEYGRQGRNGLAGFCRDILNYAEIEDECLFYQKDSEYKEKFIELYQKESLHLDVKLKKHEDNGFIKKIWKHIQENPGDREKYLQTRTLQRLKHNIKKEKNKFIQRKEYLIATLTSHVLETLLQISDRETRKELKKSWKATRKNIDALWNKRLIGEVKNDSDAVYNTFLKSTHDLWRSLCLKPPALLDQYVLMLLEPSIEDLVEVSKSESSDEQWLKKIRTDWYDKIDRSELLEVDDEAKIALAIRKLVRMSRLYHPDKCPNDKNAAKVMYSISEMLGVLKSDKVKYKKIPNRTTEKAQPTEGSSTPTVDKKTQEKDMSYVVGFYQSWVKNFSTHCLPKESLKPEIIDFLCGNDGCDLKTLYHAFDKASHRAVSPVSVAQFDNDFDDNQATDKVSFVDSSDNRICLFEILNDAFKTIPACFSLSSANWARWINKLIEPKPTSYPYTVDDHAARLFTFLKTIENKTPDTFQSKHELRVINDLFVRIMQIFEKKFIEESEYSNSFDFAKNLVNLVLTRYLDHADDRFFTLLGQVFETNSNATELFTRHTNQADLVYILDLLVKNKDNDTFSNKLTGLIAHLDENFAVLNQTPGSIRTRVTLFCERDAAVFIPPYHMLPAVVGYKKPESSPVDDGKAANTFKSPLPDTAEDEEVAAAVLANAPVRDASPQLHQKQPDVSAHFPNTEYVEEEDEEVAALFSTEEVNEPVIDASIQSHEKQPDVSTHFFAFLGQRSGFSEAEYNAFTNILPTDQGYLSELFTLPPYVKLTYLTKHLAADPGKYDIGAFNQQVAAIKQATSAFNHFLQQRNIISTTGVFNVPNDVGAYEKWTAHFETMTVVQNQTFFAAVNANGLLIDEEILTQVVSQYCDQKNKKPHCQAVLTQNVALAEKVSKLGKTHAASTFEKLYQAWALSNFDTEQYEKLLTYTNTVHSMASSLTPEELAKLTDSVTQQYDKTCLDTSLAVYGQLLTIHPPKIALELRNAYNNSAMNINHNQRYLDFCRVVKESAPFSVDGPVTVFLDAYVDQNISTPASLKDAFDVYKAFHGNDVICAQFLSAPLDDKKINRYAELSKELQRTGDVLSNYSNILHDAYIQHQTIKTPGSLKRAINVLLQLRQEPFLDNVLLSCFIIATPNAIDEARIKKYEAFIACVNACPDLSAAAVDQLARLDYLNKTDVELKTAIDTIRMAMKLNEKNNYHDYFGTFHKNKLGRVHLMHFLKSGLLDFLGAKFKLNCYEHYEDLCESTCVLPHVSKSSKEVLTWYQKINAIMHEFLQILSPAKIEKNNCKQLDFSDYTRRYDSFWFVNSARKKQMQTLKDNLNQAKEKQNTHEYYFATFNAIIETQQKIIQEDRKNNPKRFFTNLNAKGYSRLYSITNKMLFRTLEAYHCRVAGGEESAEGYAQYKDLLEKQCFFHRQELMASLPSDSLLLKELLIIDSRNYTTQDREIKFAELVLNLDDKKAVPKHLCHMLKTLKCYTQLNQDELSDARNNHVIGVS